MLENNNLFESVLVRNRLGKGMRLRVRHFSLSSDHVCVLVALSEGIHPSTLAKNADHIVLQLRERFTRTVKKFTMIEIRPDEADQEQWIQWQFNWVGNTPLEPKSQIINSQQQQYYQSLLINYEQAAGER